MILYYLCLRDLGAYASLCASLRVSALSAVKSLGPALSIRTLLCCAVSLFCACFTALAQKQTDPSVKTLSPAEGEREARSLIAQIRSQRPEQTFTNSLLKIRSRDGVERRVPVHVQTVVAPTNWSASYVASSSFSLEGSERAITKLTITHSPSGANEYIIRESGSTAARTIPPEQTCIPFATSDFFLADLGLEFLNWPEQRITKKEMYSSRYCAVLESSNSKPTRGAYARVRAWITTEPPLAPVRAEAYDASGKRIKVFDVKDVEKVNGHFQVGSVEMRNLQTGSRTVMEFDLGAQ